MQKRLGDTFIDFRPQARDVYVDDVGLGVEMVVPHVFQQHCAGNHLAGMLHQVFQQPEFARLQRNFFAPASHLVRQAVELQIAHAKHGFLVAPDPAARENLNPREQLRE
jgi:hypothetical protein